jgi:xylose dehydrogenase (NAD/NADP)
VRSVALTWGIMSTARINELILAGARQSRRVRMVAVGSRDRARAEAYAREHGLERAYGSYEELLADPGIRAVYISLPNALHIEWSIRALHAGKHVLCEKPLTPRPEEVEAAFDVAEQEGLLLMEAFMWRHHPQVRRLQDLIAEGAIGELTLVRATHSFTAGEPRDMRLWTGPDGGALLDVGCYCVHAARLIAGEPQRVYGEAVRNEAGVDVRFVGTMRFRGGVLGQFDSGLDLPRRRMLEVVGESASIRLPDPWHGYSARIELHRGGTVEEIAVEPADAYGLQLENLSDAVLDAAEPLLGRHDALQQARALEALFASADGGVPVALP